MAYSVTNVTKTGLSGIFRAEVSDGVDSISFLFHKKELTTGAGKTKLKSRVAKLFQDLNADKTTENTLKTSLNSALA